ncbi:probable cation-transporting ATPase 13A3, partial [Trichonephila clavata]
MSSKKRFYMHCTHYECSLKEAEKVFLVDAYGQEHISKVKRPGGKLSQTPFFYYKKIKYGWDEKEEKFINIAGLNIQVCSEFLDLSKGLDSEEARKRLQFYGPNSMRVEVTPIITLLLREIRSPFYIYQSFIVIIWFLQLYYQFGICIIILSVISVSSTVWETRKQSRSLRNAVRTESVATVLRNEEEMQVSSEELVPGDVLHADRREHSDHKTPISEDSSASFDVQTNKRSILSCGTEVLLCRSTHPNGVRAVVYRTGFSTSKGELVRSILFPKPVGLKLYSDLLKCMVIFFLLGTVPVIYTAIISIQLRVYVEEALLFVLNVVTFFVPPSLPAVLTSINEQAQRRLRKQGIYCLNSRYINFAGGLDVVCFDKTGTLTEDDLDILAAVPVRDQKFESAVLNLDQISSEDVIKAMATCHSLARIDGEVRGYNLDQKMFQLTGWGLQEPTLGSHTAFDYVPPRIVTGKTSSGKEESIAVVKMFPFESSLKRMSVVTQTKGKDHFDVFLKGAPELVITLSRTETVPDDVLEVLAYYSSQGFRVIALALKHLTDDVSWRDVQKLT